MGWFDFLRNEEEETWHEMQGDVVEDNEPNRVTDTWSTVKESNTENTYGNIDKEDVAVAGAMGFTAGLLGVSGYLASEEVDGDDTYAADALNSWSEDLANYAVENSEEIAETADHLLELSTNLS